MWWHADEYLEKLYDNSMKCIETAKASRTAEERKQYLKHKLRELLGDFDASKGPEPVLLERTVCDGYIRERVQLSAIPGLSFAAYVLVPDSYSRDPLPAVVALHGHGYGSREIVGLKPDGSPDMEPPGAHGHFAIQLVKRGMIVIAPDVAGFGERRLMADVTANPDVNHSCLRLSTRLMMHGKTLAGLRVTEALKTVDYAAGRAEVRDDRIGIMGFSGGGMISFLTAVLDLRIRAAVIAGYLNTFKDSILAMQHCVCNYIPGMLAHAELPEWLGLISPRPLFVESGTDDRIFPEQGFRAAADQLRDIYRRDGAENRLVADLFPGRHQISGRYSYDWLFDQLSQPGAIE
ncbi:MULTISPECIES: dienelactone hydrolase family protein [Paenibacillus]|uniref:Dienelactone hydrolase n=1 Tax=Paenibacillus lactis TaxID=228574 RepID=A0ABS4FFP2_9BACL|nr:alpha/beta hydrolase family protein [Paenibacillus lactis]MBP1895077.1 dienelactone hydrolase [Paenibacillus lactis]HAF99772.1 dienelactone hydrolase [Paenibacillus lactis]